MNSKWREETYKSNLVVEFSNNGKSEFLMVNIKPEVIREPNKQPWKADGVRNPLKSKGRPKRVRLRTFKP